MSLPTSPKRREYGKFVEATSNAQISLAVVNPDGTTVAAVNSNLQVLNVTLTGGTTDDAVTFSQQVSHVVLQARTSVDVQVRKTSAASTYFTMKAGSALSIDLIGTTVCYVRGTAATVVEVIGSY